MDKSISDLVSLIEETPKGTFFSYKNGVIQTYACRDFRGNLYLNRLPALNYYIERPNELSLFFANDNSSHISYEKFVFSGTDSIYTIATVAKTYAIAPRIVAYFNELLDYTEKGGKLYVKTK